MRSLASHSADIDGLGFLRYSSRRLDRFPIGEQDGIQEELSCIGCVLSWDWV